MKNPGFLLSAVMSATAILLLSSCQNDESFNSGWDAQIVATDVQISNASDPAIQLATLNLQDLAGEYVRQNQPDAIAFAIDNAEPVSGTVYSLDNLPLDILSGFDLFAIQDNRELQIGAVNLSQSQVSIMPIEGFRVNLYDFAGEDDFQIVARPQFSDSGSIQSVNVRVNFAASFVVSGTK